MRHLKSGKRLGVTTSHRRAMMRNLVTSLLENGKISTTLTRAKELRKDLDKMITLGKKGDLNARRQALRFVKTKVAMANLFDMLPNIYSERNGGYSRIYKLKKRLGDNAKMALIELVDFKFSSKKVSEEVLFKKEESTLEEVKAEVITESEVDSKVLEDISDEKSNEENKDF